MNRLYRWMRAVSTFIFPIFLSLLIAGCQSETESPKQSESMKLESSETDASKENTENSIFEIESEKDVPSTEDTTAALIAELRAKITPQEGDGTDLLWAKFQYAWGYGFDDLVTECLDAYEAAGQDYDVVLANAARKFLSQAAALGYDTGCAICFFEDFKDHPTLLVGDIIVAVDNQPVASSDDITGIKAESGTDTWIYTILRSDENEILFEIHVTVQESDPLAGNREIKPKTLD